MTEVAAADRPLGTTVGQPFLVGGAQRGRGACLKTHSNYEHEGHAPKFPVQCSFPFCFPRVIIHCTNTAITEKETEKKKKPLQSHPPLGLSPWLPTSPTPFGEGPICFLLFVGRLRLTFCTFSCCPVLSHHIPALREATSGWAEPLAACLCAAPSTSPSNDHCRPCLP